MRKLLKYLLCFCAVILSITMASCSTQAGQEASGSSIYQIAKDGDVVISLISQGTSDDPYASEYKHDFYFSENITADDFYVSGALSGKKISSVVYIDKSTVYVNLTGTASSTSGWGAIVLKSGWIKAEREPVGGDATQFVYRVVVGDTTDKLSWNDACTKVGTSEFDVLKYLR